MKIGRGIGANFCTVYTIAVGSLYKEQRDAWAGCQVGNRGFLEDEAAPSSSSSFMTSMYDAVLNRALSGFSA